LFCEFSRFIHKFNPWGFLVLLFFCSMKSILVVDDHPIIGFGLQFLLKKYLMEVNVFVETAVEAVLTQIKNKQFDLVIMDVLLPKTDTQSLVNRIMTLQPATAILMHSSCSEEIYAMPYMQLGAKGYLHKSASDEEVLLAISTVLSGHIFISKKAAKQRNIFYNTLSNNPFGELSKRELEVLSHLLLGRSVKEIAEVLNLGQSTIATQKSRILSKVNVSNIVDLVKLAEQYGLLNDLNFES